MQWYTKVQNIEGKYKTEAQRVHISNERAHYVYTMHCIIKANQHYFTFNLTYNNKHNNYTT